MYVCMSVYHNYIVRGKYLEEENIGEFGEFMGIRQIFTLQMSWFYHPNSL